MVEIMTIIVAILSSFVYGILAFAYTRYYNRLPYWTSMTIGFSVMVVIIVIILVLCYMGK